jgi:hypothetical protein
MDATDRPPETKADLDPTRAGTDKGQETRADLDPATAGTSGRSGPSNEAAEDRLYQAAGVGYNYPAGTSRPIPASLTEARAAHQQSRRDKQSARGGQADRGSGRGTHSHHHPPEGESAETRYTLPGQSGVNGTAADRAEERHHRESTGERAVPGHASSYTDSDEPPQGEYPRHGNNPPRGQAPPEGSYVVDGIRYPNAQASSPPHAPYVDLPMRGGPSDQVHTWRAPPAGRSQRTRQGGD